MNPLGGEGCVWWNIRLTGKEINEPSGPMRLWDHGILMIVVPHRSGGDTRAGCPQGLQRRAGQVGSHWSWRRKLHPWDSITRGQGRLRTDWIHSTRVRHRHVFRTPSLRNTLVRVLVLMAILGRSMKARQARASLELGIKRREVLEGGVGPSTGKGNGAISGQTPPLRPVGDSAYLGGHLETEEQMSPNPGVAAGAQDADGAAEVVAGASRSIASEN
eukprot:CAMPEP_0114559140 /NCGR_PEP_ID=MMETSP0114-20121206/10764_1 /TAXON_ID=31324 /ORGANISM="Goniomonas sp, Strain m" /LENGTH=216 /DNA_ID=CAMNT_0001744593 /DNA_START=334 /DNA_END=986 /DNA_ORIENTATION=-